MSESDPTSIDTKFRLYVSESLQVLEASIQKLQACVESLEAQVYLGTAIPQGHISNTFGAVYQATYDASAKAAHQAASAAAFAAARKGTAE